MKPRPLLTVVLPLVLPLAFATAQQPPFHQNPDPIGTVVDEAGQPIAGARITLVLDSAIHRGGDLHDLTFHRQPPPVVVSQDDGSFVLPLAPIHRRLGMDPTSAVLLVVEKDGWIPWREPITGGLHAYLGSRALLRRPRAEDRVTLEIKEPRPGALFLARHLGAADTRVVAVPANGRLALTLPLVPNPAVFGQQNLAELIELGWEGQLLDPGRSSKPMPIPRGESVWPDQPAGSVVANQAAALPRERGLYRCPDGALRWFPVHGETAAEDAACRLVLLHAEGGIARQPFTERPAGPGAAMGVAVDVVVQEEQGAPVADAFVELHRLEDWDPDRVLPPGRRPLRAWRTDERGGFVLPAELGSEPAFLYVSAPGHPFVVVLEPRARGPQLRVTLPRLDHGTVALTVVRDDGQPVRDALVALSRERQQTLHNPAALPRTDAEGRLVLHGLRAGEAPVTVLAEGCIAKTQNLKVESDGTSEVRFELARAAEAKVLTVDGDERPLAFARWQVFTGTSSATRVTDSLGRLWLRQLQPDTASQLGCMSLTDRFDLQTEPGVQTVVGSDSPPVLLLLPEQLRAFRPTWIMGDGGSTTSDATVPGGTPLLHWKAKANGQLCVGIGDGPPVRILGSEVLDTRRRDQVVVVDRRELVRRVPLKVTAGGAPVTGFHVAPKSPHYGGGMLCPDEGDMVVQEGTAHWFVARDRGAYECIITHPEYVLDHVDVPEGDDAQLSIELTRGAPVTFVFAPQAADRGKVSVMLHGKDGAPQVLMLQNLRLPEPQDGKVQLRCPVALPKGKWTASLQSRAGGRPPAEFEVDGATALVLDLDQPGRER